MQKKFVYNGTFQGYAEFTYFMSKHYPARKTPVVEFDRYSNNMYVKDENGEFVLRTGDTFVVETNIEVIREEDNELVG